MDLSFVRSEFPALAETDSQGRPFAFLDGPGGTQVHESVIAAMADYLRRANANVHGAFATSVRSDAVISGARRAMADLLNAPSPDCIIFGLNMTSLTLHISQALGRLFRPGDEVVITTLDHNADVSPWQLLAERGIVVREAHFRPEDCTLDMVELQGLLNPRTRLVAVGYASNGTGTINDVAAITRWAHQVGAWTYIDAVHYAPHGPIDVQAADCDFLVCSPYKFFGPHAGVLWGRREILEQLRPAKIRATPDTLPDRFETGTKNHEALAGITAAVDYLASVGRRTGAGFAERFPGFAGRRLELKTGLSAIQACERELCWRLIEGLRRFPGLKIWGITDPAQAAWRAPTVSFTVPGSAPRDIAARLGEEGLFVWDGDFYALTLMEELGLAKHGGMVRVGLMHYNTRQEVDRLLEALQKENALRRR